MYLYTQVKSPFALLFDELNRAFYEFQLHGVFSMCQVTSGHLACTPPDFSSSGCQHGKLGLDSVNWISPIITYCPRPFAAASQQVPSFSDLFTLTQEHVVVLLSCRSCLCCRSCFQVCSCHMTVMKEDDKEAEKRITIKGGEEGW